MGWPRVVEGLAAQMDSAGNVSLVVYPASVKVRICIPFVIDIGGCTVEVGER